MSSKTVIKIILFQTMLRDIFEKKPSLVSFGDTVENTTPPLQSVTYYLNDPIQQRDELKKLPLLNILDKLPWPGIVYIAGFPSQIVWRFRYKK
jgi:hypothetical protein